MAFAAPFARAVGSTRARALVSALRRRSMFARGARTASMSAGTQDAMKVTDAEWREKLTGEQYRILRQKGTERARSGQYDKFYPKGATHFACAGCGNPLYSAQAKFDSGCGWPAFDKCYKGAVRTETDVTFGMRRVEILCARCDGHLGHVFEGERMTPTNERHCVNSVSIKYVEAAVDAEEAKVV